MLLQRGIHALNEELQEIKPMLTIDIKHLEGFFTDSQRNKQMTETVLKEIKDLSDLSSDAKEYRAELVVLIRNCIQAANKSETILTIK